jgi:hypothetical protein
MNISGLANDDYAETARSEKMSRASVVPFLDGASERLLCAA